MPEALDSRYQPTLAGDLTPEKLAELLANAPAADSIAGIAFNRHHPDNPPLWALVNSLKARRSGTISFGGVASARGLAKMYAVAASQVENKPPLLTAETLSQVTQIQSRGEDLVLKTSKRFPSVFMPALNIILRSVRAHLVTAGLADSRHSLIPATASVTAIHVVSIRHRSEPFQKMTN